MSQEEARMITVTVWEEQDNNESKFIEIKAVIDEEEPETKELKFVIDE